MSSSPALRPLKSVSPETATGGVPISTPEQNPRGLFWRRAVGVWRKELQVEWRARYSLNSSLLFALSTLVLLSLVVGPSAARSDLAAALLWIVLLFSATAGLGHNFAREVESGTLALLRQSVPAGPVLLGKWLAAGSLILVVVVLILFASSILFAPVVGNVGGFLAVLALGTLALAVTLPLISSLLAYARRHGGLVSVLAFPILLPGLLTSVVGTKRALEGEWPGGELRVLVAIVGVMAIAGWRLFEFVWNE